MEIFEGRLSPYNTELRFIGKYGTVVHMCSDPQISGGELTVSQALTYDLPTVLAYATAMKNNHLILHQEAGTEPCLTSVDPVSAIFKNGANRVIWIPIDALTGASPPTKPRL